MVNVGAMLAVPHASAHSCANFARIIMRPKLRRVSAIQLSAFGPTAVNSPEFRRVEPLLYHSACDLDKSLSSKRDRAAIV